MGRIKTEMMRENLQSAFLLVPDWQYSADATGSGK
jgi:hypothetical protein